MWCPVAGKPRVSLPTPGLEVTPEFLDQVIAMLKTRGFDLVNLDEAQARIASGGPPFAAFTLDDGYRDNLVHAQPVFRRHDCPYTVYVAPAIADGTCELWWRGLEAAIAAIAEVRPRSMASPSTLLVTATAGEMGGLEPLVLAGAHAGAA